MMEEVGGLVVKETLETGEHKECAASGRREALG